uniref:Uncharacterized protein n=1 Tax=Romanomermis culicivorax TaxID=13658 RepID=A0A915IR64_ROMCU
MNFLLITVAYSLISLLWAKPQGFSGIIDNVDPGYNVPAGGYNNYNNYNNYQQQQQPQNCYEMQEKRLGQFVFTCHNNNYEPSACLSQQGLGQVQLGERQILLYKGAENIPWQDGKFDHSFIRNLPVSIINHQNMHQYYQSLFAI